VAKLGPYLNKFGRTDSARRRRKMIFIRVQRLLYSHREKTVSDCLVPKAFNAKLLWPLIEDTLRAWMSWKWNVLSTCTTQ
jgi:hypothetical protein